MTRRDTLLLMSERFECGRVNAETGVGVLHPRVSG